MILIISQTCDTIWVYVFCRLRTADFHGLPAENLPKADFNLKNNSLLRQPTHSHLHTRTRTRTGATRNTSRSVITKFYHTALWFLINSPSFCSIRQIRTKSILHLTMTSKANETCCCVFTPFTFIWGRMSIRVMTQENTQRQAETFQWTVNTHRWMEWIERVPAKILYIQKEFLSFHRSPLPFCFHSFVFFVVAFFISIEGAVRLFSIEIMSAKCCKPFLLHGSIQKHLSLLCRLSVGSSYERT